MKKLLFLAALLLSLLVYTAAIADETVTVTIDGNIWDVTYTVSGGTAKIKTMVFSKDNARSWPAGGFVIPSSINGIPAPNVSYVETYTYFNGTRSLMTDTSQTLQEGIVSINNLGFYRYPNGMTLFLRLPNSLKRIGDSAFADIANICPIDAQNTFGKLPDGLEYLGKSAFAYSGLKYLRVPASITHIYEDTFLYCRDLSWIELPDTLEAIDAHAFENCSSLKYIYLPRSVKQIAATAFSSHPADFTIFCPPDSYAAQYAQEQGIPYVICDKNGEAGGSAVREGDWLYQESGGGIRVLGYYGAESEVVVPSSLGGKPVTSLGAAFNVRFPLNSSLSGDQIKKVSIPDTVTEIGDYAFYGCYELKTLELPASLQRIGSCAFHGIAVKELDVPAGVTSIASDACSARQSLKLRVVYGTAAEQYAKDMGFSYAYYHSAPTSITVTGPDTVIYGKSAQIAFTVTPEDLNLDNFDEPEFTFVSDDPAIAAVSEDGRIYGAKPGTTTIYVIDKTDPFINTSFEVTVEDKTVALSSAYIHVSFSGGAAQLTYGTVSGEAPFQIELLCSGYRNASFSDTVNTFTDGKAETQNSLSLPTKSDKVTFSETFTVRVTDANGSVSTATGACGITSSSYQVGVGTPTYSVRMVNGVYQYTASYPSYTTQYSYTPYARSSSAPVSTAALPVSDMLFLLAGESKALLSGSAANTVFFSADPSVAQVSEDGVVQGMAIGETVIDAYTIDGSGRHKQVCVQVLSAYVTSVSLEAGENSEGVQPVAATVLPEEATVKTLHWESSDPTVAEVDQEGTVTWRKAGDVTIYASTMDGTVISQSVALHWDGILIKSITLYLDPLCDRHLLWTILPENATNQEVTLAVDNPVVVDLHENHYFNFKKEGSANIRINAADGSGVSATLRVSGTPEHAHKVFLDGEARAATANRSGAYPNAVCMICGKTVLEATPILFSKCLTLPSGLRAIAAEAFASGNGAQQIVIPEGTKEIGEGAFADSEGLLAVVIPDTVTDIAENAFLNAPFACILCGEGSAAEQYAQDNGLLYQTVR